MHMRKVALICLFFVFIAAGVGAQSFHMPDYYMLDPGTSLQFDYEDSDGVKSPGTYSISGPYDRPGGFSAYRVERRVGSFWRREYWNWQGGYLMGYGKEESDGFFEHYTNPLEMIPESLPADTENLWLEDGGAYYGEDYTGTDKIRITCHGIENIAIGGGNYDALHLSIHGEWTDNDGWRGDDEIDSWFVKGVGIVKFNLDIRVYEPGEGWKSSWRRYELQSVPSVTYALALSGVEDAGGGIVSLTWADASPTPPWRFLGLSYDLYTGQWVDRAPDGSIWYSYSSSATDGPMKLEYTGAYFTWIFRQEWDASLIQGENPATHIMYGGKPHKPIVEEELIQASSRQVEVKWKPDVYGTWLYWLIAYHVDSGQWVSTNGPLGESLWQYVVYGSADFLEGSAILTVPASGQYGIFLAGMAWDGQTWSDFQTVTAVVP